MSQIISITKPGNATVVKTWDSADSAKKDIFVYNNGADIIFNGSRENSFLIQPIGNSNHPTIAASFANLDDNYATANAEAFVDYLSENNFFLKASGSSGAVSISESSTSVLDFNAKGDGVQLNDWDVTGSNLYSPTVSFTASDVGKIVSIGYAGASGQHLVTTISAFLDVNNVTLALAATTDVTSKTGSYGTDNIKPFQNAFDYAILNNVKLGCPEGVFLIGDLNDDTGTNSIRLYFTKANQNLNFEGAGKGLTVIRELDGKTQRIGRYTKMFYHYLNVPFDVGHLSLSSLTLDKNSRSLTVNPSSEFEWEQSHAISWAGAENGVELVQSLTFRDLETYDCSGAGINWSSNPTKLGSGVFKNLTRQTESYSFRDEFVLLGSYDATTNTPDLSGIVANNGERYNVSVAGTQMGQTFEVDDQVVFTNGGWFKVAEGRLTNKNGILLGQRCDLEISPYSENVFIDSCNLDCAQIEPVNVASKANPRGVKVVNCNILTFQYTENKDSDQSYCNINITNLISKNFLVRNCNYSVMNSVLTVNEIITARNGFFQGCTFLVPYDSDTNTIQGFQAGYLTTIGLPNKTKFLNCDFLIDSDDPLVSPDGYVLLRVNSAIELSTVIVDGCYFDVRLKSNVDAHAGGVWIFKNNTFSGSYRSILVGAFGSQTSHVRFENNDFSSVVSQPLHLQNNNLLWELQLNEKITADQYHLGSTGSAGNRDTQITRNAILVIDDVVNRSSSGIDKGTIFELEQPTAGQHFRYIVTASTNGGSTVVKGMGLLEA